MNLESARNGGGRNGRRGGLSAVEPWASVIGGSALAVFGVTRKSLSGAALAGVGGLLVYHGFAQQRHPQHVHVERTITVMKPVDEIYRFWRNFENLPQFMSHLESVNSTGDRFSEWTARAPLGTKVNWRAEITDESENQYIIWRSLPGSEIENVGSVQFHPAPGDRGTEITVALQYNPPAGKVGDALAYLFGQAPEQQVREDLRHLKQLLEAGEIPTTHGQSHGRRSMIGKAAQRWGTDEKEVRRTQGESARIDRERAIREVPA
jgi:uncharacterized membrane protein